MQTRRTPDERFAELPDWPDQPHHVDVPGAQGQLRTTAARAGR